MSSCHGRVVFTNPIAGEVAQWAHNASITRGIYNLETVYNRM